MVAKTAQPWRVSPHALPNIHVKPAGIEKITIIWMYAASGVGPSKGCAELALKYPPPLVPSSLIASIDAEGPRGSVCVAPSGDGAGTGASSAWGRPSAT